MLPYGPQAVLVEFDSLAEVMAAAGAWRAAAWPAVVDIVPAARTVLVQHDGRFDHTLLFRPTEGLAVVAGPAVTIDVVYDGADLAAVADATGLSVEAVIALHTEAEYTVAFCGFMPGFAYMVGLPPVLHLPRRRSPRTRVPAGSVAIAAEYAAVYPDDSPGGWHLLGSTDAVLWDEARRPPALLAPGTPVRFRQR
ncbi:MAG: allophanate hydrolase subunit 1 [Actinomycetota bacterium]|nr:allophanate hydrolase subunit 1 [Actinomycetota bacterium]